MLQQLIAHSPDIKRLQDEGYDIAVQAGYLLVRNVPYVNASKQISLGTLASTLCLSGNKTHKPDNHVAYWVGDHPCKSDGSKLTTIENGSETNIDLGNGTQAKFTFSAKPTGQITAYGDYHHKMTTYIGCILGQARVLDETVTAQIFPVVPAENTASIFNYVDTASSRNGTDALNERFSSQRIGIVGLGGTGSYVLDLVAKTNTREIHLFDYDVFLQHNAFRAPSAASINELQEKSAKVDYLTNIYSRIRKGIVPHNLKIDADSVHKLLELDFVFVCMDGGPSKKATIDALVAAKVPFVDVGLGVIHTETGLTGTARVTLVTPSTPPSILDHINCSDNTANNEYSTNIQIVELNAINAAFAVLSWKRHLGFYRNSSESTSYGFSIAANDIIFQ